MLGSAIPATATIHTSTTSATPTSPTRPSRLRGLSYLRNYTRDHLSASSRSDVPVPAIPPSLSVAPSAIGAQPPTREQEGESQRYQTESIEATTQSGEEERRPRVREGVRPDPRHVALPAEGEPFEAAGPRNTTALARMTRGRAASAQPGPTSTPLASSASMQRRPSLGEGMSTEPLPEGNDAAAASKEGALPMIRFIPHVEPRSSRPSLQFAAVARTLKQPASVVRVGRYSERDAQSTSPNSSVTPVGFKSKVVSRRHCEFWCTNGQWYVKDVKSSSGTFLNHVRLSSPGTESRPYPVVDGDVIQLGIDFKGGEEVIFRCVKIRIECNRGWQSSLNNFNTSAHKRLLNNNSKAADSDATSTGSSECSICLNPVAPCQALFVAPCSHVWHYKCIRNLIEGRNWPNFLCPNCRFVADLDADVEPPEGLDSILHDEAQNNGGAEIGEVDDEVQLDPQDGGTWDHETQHADAARELRGVMNRDHSQDIPEEELNDMMHTTTLNSQNESTEDPPLPARGSSTRPVNITTSRSASSEVLAPRSATPTSNAQFALAAGVMSMPLSSAEGQMTPRNHAGPFVFDGNDRGDRAGDT